MRNGFEVWLKKTFHHITVISRLISARILHIHVLSGHACFKSSDSSIAHTSFALVNHSWSEWSACHIILACPYHLHRCFYFFRDHHCLVRIISKSFTPEASTQKCHVHFYFFR